MIVDYYASWTFPGRGRCYFKPTEVQQQFVAYFRAIAKQLYGPFPFSVYGAGHEINPKRKSRFERSFISGRKLRPW